MSTRTTPAPLAAFVLSLCLCGGPLARAAGADAPAPAVATFNTWPDAVAAYSAKCPAPFFAVKAPVTVKAFEHTFRITGSTATRVGDPWTGPLTIGVLSAIKDASAETRENLARAQAEFTKAGVNFVVINGDIAESGDLLPGFLMVAQQIKLPVFVHSGNIEWTTQFTEAFTEVSKTYPHVFNTNLLRDVDLGGVHLLSLPGWSNVKYVKPAACRYGTPEVDALKGRARELAAKGDVVIVTAHGPPRGRGKQAIDFADQAGNVGDEDLQKLLVDVPVRFGLFGHILEAGGRATSDMDRQLPVKLPMKEAVAPLYINAGSASSFGWAMNDGSTSRGMAAVVVFDDLKAGGKAKVTFLKLR